MNKKQNRKLTLFILPGLAGLAVFFMIPIVIMVMMSFSAMGELSFQHYQQVLQSKAFQLALGNTLRLLVSGVPLILIVGVLFALVFHMIMQQDLPGGRFLFLMHLLPLVLPSAVTVLFVEAFFPYSSAPQVGILMTGLYIWKNIPYVLLVAFLGLRSIPADVSCAAKLDGANGMQLLRFITLPYLKPYLLVGIVLALLGVFRIYRESYLLFGSYPDQSVYFLQNYMNNLFYSFSYGQVAAASDLFLAGLSILLISALYRLGKGGRQ